MYLVFIPKKGIMENLSGYMRSVRLAKGGR